MAEEVQDSAYGQEPSSPAHTIEVVGWFADRESFKRAVKELLKNGFARTDLSVLDSHESLSAADNPREVFKEAVSGLIQEIHYIGPIAAAGFIAVATGPVGALVSATVGAGLTGYALRDVLEEVRATPHTEAFARAAENGAILLWVRAETPEAQEKAVTTLTRNGAQGIHTHERLRAQGREDDSPEES